MKSSDNILNYFPDNKLAKLSNLVQFKRMLMYCLQDWGEEPAPAFLGYCTGKEN